MGVWVVCLYKGVVSVAEVIDAVRVDFPYIVGVSVPKVSAACRVFIKFARLRPVHNKIWIYEFMVNHVVGLSFFQVSVLKAHQPISDQDSAHVDGDEWVTCVVGVNSHCQVWNILAGVRLASQPKGVLVILAKLLQEVYNGVECILGCLRVIEGPCLIQVVAVANSCR